jgi:hypothetical protein
MTRRPTAPPLALLVALALAGGTACAEEAAPPISHGNGKLLLTGGVSTIDGVAGGGLTPWAVTASYATEGQFGGTAHATRVSTQDYALTIYGAAVGIADRFELSIARQDFDTGATGAALGLPGLHLRQDIVGIKWRVAGDAVVDSDRWMPQIAIGAEFKSTNAAGLAPTLGALGARTNGTDIYLSATKLFLAQGILVNGTLRATKANQNGLLGFGGTAHDGYSLQPEVSLAWLLRKDLAVGVEYRAKPDNLNPSLLGAGLKEDDWADQFCQLAGGPCHLKGPDMKQAHDGFDIDRSAFKALVEVLQQAMDAQGIAFGVQNRLLARLAPMHREIVNVKGSTP